MAASRRVKTLPHFLEAPSGLACRRGLGPGVLLGSPGRACRWRDSTEQRGVWGYRGRYASPWRRRPACAPAATSGTWRPWRGDACHGRAAPQERQRWRADNAAGRCGAHDRMVCVTHDAPYPSRCAMRCYTGCWVPC